MDNKCSKCGGNSIAGRLMAGAHFIGFTPLADEKKLKPRYVGLICDTCVQCGSVENIRVEKVDKLK